MSHEKDGYGPRIHANAIVMVLRRELGGDTSNLRPEQKQAVEAHVIACGHQCVSGLTDEQILKVAYGKATLEGCSPGPITFKELP